MNLFKTTDILIPKDKSSHHAWSVVACDQYTSQPEYWEQVRQTAGNTPSAYNIIFPEVYLNDGDSKQRIQNINSCMEKYLDENIFDTIKDSFIYVRRTQRDGRIREGIVGAVDLEEYDFSKGSQSLIRATEGTILERIPPRVKIRENAPLELPHIIMLIDDDACSIIEPLSACTGDMDKIYDFDLMMDSGHLEGYVIPGHISEKIIKRIENIASPEYFADKYQISDKGVLAFAVGDGNHSLATAKTCWENIKKTLSHEEQLSHPARFALVELENIHSPALEFEPIHRAVFGVEPYKMINALKEFYDTSDRGTGQRITYMHGGIKEDIVIKNPKSNLAVGSLQIFIDDYLQKYGGEVDYIHGADVVEALSQKDNTIGFIVPEISKHDLFKTVIADGALPRKTFSMGEAWDKRFYMEAKRIE